MDPLAKAYLKIISENVSELQNTKNPEVKGSSQKEDEIFGDPKNKIVQKPIKGSGTDDVDDLDEPTKAPAHLQQQDGKPKAHADANYKESKNPFDVLYNKILREEGEGLEMDFSTPKPSVDGEGEGGSDLADDSSFDMSSDSSTDDDGEKVKLELDRDVAEKLIELLHTAIGDDSSDDSSDDSTDDLSDDSSDDSSDSSDDTKDSDEFAGEDDQNAPFGNVKKEAVEAEIQGHALVDQEKLTKGLTSKSNNTVKGAVPVTKKSATTPSGKKPEGKYVAHSTEPSVSSLTSKSNIDAKGVSVGKTIFDNE
jgi:hypothetical protein